MSPDNPYRAVVAGYVELLQSGRRLPLGAPPSYPVPATDAERVLLFSPHPDDECLIAGLPLRLQRQCGMAVINVAVTLGSRRERQAERWHELAQACRYLGFALQATAPHGLERIHPTARRKAPQHWQQAVAVIAAIIAEQQPLMIVLPHAQDWNLTHIGTHWLVRDALRRQPPGFVCWLLETEYWTAMAAPNLMVESSVTDVAELMAALSCHRGEVLRNPYHLRLPAWLIDNVRRGSELVQGQGAAAPEITFATLYRLRRWRAGRGRAVAAGGRVLTATDDPLALFR